MAQETTEPQGKSGRPKWMGYAQLVLILAAIGVALYFAQAPSRVERDPISDLAPEQGPSQPSQLFSRRRPNTR